MFHKRKTKIYFAPHQDDELLSMGVDVCASVLAGDDVHVVLCSDGSKSGVRRTLCNGKTCAKHEGKHTFELSTPEFIQARDREFTDSCLALGVPRENIHIHEKREVDGSFVTKNGEAIIRHYLEKLGKDALVCTISPSNGAAQHRDHKALGKAADNLVMSGVISAARFFVEPYHYHQIAENPRAIPVLPEIQKASPKVAQRIRNAIAAYSLWNPTEGRYAVGYHSVTTEFDDFLKEMTARSFVKYSPKHMSRLRRLEQQHQKWRKFHAQKQLYYSMDRCEAPDLKNLRVFSAQSQEWDAYRDFCAGHGIKPGDREKQRFADGSSFWCLLNEDDTVLSTGWLAYRQRFYIGETDYGFDMSSSDSAILFDFNTKPEHRGKGYYGLLLRAMMSRAEGPRRYVIYTSPDNVASARGIVKAGFRFDGTLSAEGNTMKPYLLKAGFTSVYRKNRLWGLRVTK